MLTSNEEIPDAPEAPKSRPSTLNSGVGWYAVLIVAAYLFCADAPTLVERSGYGPIRVQAARVGYALIAARAVVAVLFRNRSWAWACYAILLLGVGPLVVLLARSP